jgi:cell division protein FtsW (lipid II flippase)
MGCASTRRRQFGDALVTVAVIAGVSALAGMPRAAVVAGLVGGALIAWVVVYVVEIDVVTNSVRRRRR